MRFALLLVAVLLAGMVFAACGSDDGNDDDGEPDQIESPVNDADDGANGDAPAEDANEADGFSLPGSGLAAPLTDTYDTSGAAFSQANLPIAPGSVIARWYQSDGMYVVHYDGLDLAVTGPLCPGNSIQTAAGFDSVSNAPTGDGACSTATTLVDPPTGVRLCGDQVLYLTAIPVETEGTLYGTIERFREDDTIIGLTSKVEADSVAAPVVDLSSCETP